MMAALWAYLWWVTPLIPGYAIVRRWFPGELRAGVPAGLAVCFVVGLAVLVPLAVAAARTEKTKVILESSWASGEPILSWRKKPIGTVRVRWVLHRLWPRMRVRVPQVWAGKTRLSGWTGCTCARSAEGGHGLYRLGVATDDNDGPGDWLAREEGTCR
jgi:hypothetical protein